MIAHQLLNTTNTLIQIYQVPIGNQAAVNIRICNQNSTPIHFSLVVSDTASPDGSYYMTYGEIVYPNDIYTEAGVVLAAGDYIFVSTDTSGVSVVVTGYVQAT